MIINSRPLGMLQCIGLKIVSNLLLARKYLALPVGQGTHGFRCLCTQSWFASCWRSACSSRNCCSAHIAESVILLSWQQLLLMLEAWVIVSHLKHSWVPGHIQNSTAAARTMPLLWNCNGSGDLQLVVFEQGGCLKVGVTECARFS